MQLKPEDAKRVSAKRKTPRPSYFSAELGVWIEISEDFEAVLILLDSAKKQRLIQQLDSTESSDSAGDKRDTILVAALQQEATNAEAIIRETNQALSDAQNAVSVFASDPFFQSVAEVGMLNNDMQLSVDEILMTNQRAFHNGVIAKLLSEINAGKGQASARKAQKDSWRNIVSEYL